MILTRLIEFLEAKAGPKTVVVLVMAILPFNALLFPIVGDKLEELSGYRLLDSLFSYSSSEAYHRIQAYGPSGRFLYLVSSWSIDFIYPLLYAFLLSFLLTLFLRRSYDAGSPIIRLQLLPFGMMVFDYVENFLIAVLLAFFPTKITLLAQAASFFTSLKWCFAAITFLALIFAIVELLRALSKGTKPKGDIP